MKKERYHFTHNGQVYTMIYEDGFAPMWAIYRGTQARESRYVTGYKAWRETFLPSQVIKKFCESH